MAAPEAAPAAVSFRSQLVLALGLVVLVAAVYAPVRHHEYVDLDDMKLLIANPDMQPGSVGEALSIAFTKPQFSGWVPVTTLTHQLDRALWGLEPAGPLLTNVALHALATVLLLFAFARLTGRLGASAFVAGVFALHPLHVESVAWAMERKDVLSGVFFAGLLWTYARYVERPESGARYRTVLACLLLGLLSKPSLVTAPFVLLLLDYWPLERLDREALREKVPMFAMVGILSVMTLQAQGDTGAFTFGANLPAWARIENALDSLVAYLADAFWPSGLAAYYPHPGASLGPVWVAGCAALLTATTAGAWLLRRQQPWLLVGWLWFGGMLVPMLGLVQVGMQARADRYTYLSLIGLSVAVAFAADHIARGPSMRRGAAALGVTAVLALAGASQHQVPVWRSSYTLYERMIEVHPQAAFPELRLGIWKVFQNRLPEARPHLERAYELDPAQAATAVPQLRDMATFFHQVGEPAQARRIARWAKRFALQIGDEDGAAELESRLEEWRRQERGVQTP